MYRSRIIQIIILASLIFTSTAQAATLKQVGNLAHAGAADLAISVIDKNQPDATRFLKEWIEWERLRISILKQKNRHAAIVKRLTKIPENVPTETLAWAMTERATAQLEINDNQAARLTLRELIWSVKKEIPDKAKQSWSPQELLPRWRKMIIQSYLQDGFATDALTAITRYRQDYGEDDLAGVLLYARILLINDQNAAATRLLSKYSSKPQAGMLNLLAQLRNKSRPPRKVLQAALRQMQGDWVKDELATYLWAIVAEAASRSQDHMTQVQALENLLTDPNYSKLPDGLFELHADDLWKAYHDYALIMGNKAQFLVGDDAQWYKAAETSKNKIDSRAYLGFLLQRGQDSKIMSQAAELLRQQLEKDEKGKRLLAKLFLESDQFQSFSDIPLSIRYILVENAIAQQDIPTASRILATIQSAPEGVDDFMWRLRRARVLIMGGHATESNIALTELLNQHATLEQQAFDRFVQVVFDLQSLGAHDEAILLFTSLLTRFDDTQRQRELYYWIADSYKAKQEYRNAAQAYLQSAMLTDADMMDPWGQTARYQAAKVLMQGKVYSDARTIYEHLLRVTDDQSRRAVLERELQQLKIMQHQ